MKHEKIFSSTLICLVLMLSTFSTLQTPSSSATYAKDKSTNLATKTKTSEPSTALYSDIFNCLQLSSPMNHYQSNKIMGALTVTDPWPQHDELTENVDWPPLNPCDGFSVPDYGWWWEINGGIWGNVMIVENRTYNVCVDKYSVMSRVRAFGIGDPYWIPHFVVFWPSEYLDLTKWHYIKYYISLGGFCDGFCQIGFFSGDIYGDYEYAVINYTTSNDNQFYPKSFDCWDYSKWKVSAGFNWSAVDGLAFFARTSAGSGDDSGLNDMWIDSPILYSGSTDVPYGLIDFDEMETEDSEIGVELIHAGPESIADYDFYTIHVTFRSKGRMAAYWILPFVKILMVMDDEASEYLNNHQPQHGYYDYQTVMSYGVPGIPISFPIVLPQLQVEYSEYYEDGLYKIQWIVRDPMRVLFMGRNVIENNCYADFTVTIKVPARFKPYIALMAEAQWYECEHSEVWGHTWSHEKTEQLCWLVVDPPEASTITPEVPTPTVLPTEVPAGVTINEMRTLDFHYETPKTVFQRGDSFGLFVNYAWRIENATQYAFDARVYDSRGELIGGFWLKCWIWKEGYYILTGTKWMIVGFSIPQSAALGEAKIVCRFLTDWSFEPTSDVYGFEEVITIEIVGD